MFTKIGMFLATTFLWAAYWVSPREVRAVMSGFRESVNGISEVLAKGITSGVIVARWSIDEAGMEFAYAQQQYCIDAAQDFREEWEAYGPDYDEA